MSSEVVKKRGRPKKVTTDPIDVTIEPKKSAVRQKSTKAAKVTTPPPASVKAAMAAIKSCPSLNSTATEVSTPIASKTVLPPAAKAAPVAGHPTSLASKAPLKPGAPAATSTTSKVAPKIHSAPIPAIKPPLSPSPPKVTLATSKILTQVKDLAPKTTSTSSSKVASITSSTTPKTANPISKFPFPPKPTSLSTPAAKPTSSKPLRYQTSSSAAAARITKPTPPSPPRAAVSPNTAATAAGTSIPAATSITPVARAPESIPGAAPIPARDAAVQAPQRHPHPSRPKPLPPNYRRTARRVTMTIVALPIAMVTSWVLYERLILGRERKELVRPGMAHVKVDVSTGSDVRGVENAKA